MAEPEEEDYFFPAKRGGDTTGTGAKPGISVKITDVCHFNTLSRLG